MNLFLKILVFLIALRTAAWLHVEAAGLASDAKLLLARVLIWGSIAAIYSIWLAWRPITDSLCRLAARSEQRRLQPQLRHREKASAAERVLILLFLTVCVFVTDLAISSPDTFVRLFSEDGPFETATVVCYAVSALSCISFAVQARGRRSLCISLSCLAALFVIVGGEEISWGQRLLDFETPEGLAAVNVQGEFTLHNVYSISLFTYPALATTATLLFVVPSLQALNPQVRRVFRALELPVAPLSCAILYGLMICAYLIVGFRLGTPTPLPISYSGYVPHFDDEMLEFLISALFSVFAVTNWRLRLPSEEGAISVRSSPARQS